MQIDIDLHVGTICYDQVEDRKGVWIGEAWVYIAEWQGGGGKVEIWATVLLAGIWRQLLQIGESIKRCWK